MKKVLSILLVIALSLFIATTAFAEPIGTEGGSANKEVTGTYVSGGTEDTVYSVDVTWGSMEFTYTDSFIGTWNAITHQYDEPVAAAWSCASDANKITVTNHSNTPVTATMSYTPEASYTEVTSSFTKESISLATAVSTSLENAPTDSSLLTLSGALDNMANSTVIGSVTVTLN
ncbi:MAG: hypothetical protein ACOX8Q_09390 [Christensenellales bacterium]